MRNNSPLIHRDPALIPGCSDPEITRAQAREARAWVDRHHVLVGDWIRVFKVPANGAFSNVIGEGVELYRRFMGGQLINPKYLEKINYDDAFFRGRSEPLLVSLRTKPLGGSNGSLGHIRTAFATAGRKVASNPEVVAGFVAYHVASMAAALEHKAHTQELDLRGGSGWLLRTPVGFLTQGFAPGNVFRSASATFHYNSQVGLQKHDLPSEKGAPDLYVVERL